MTIDEIAAQAEVSKSTLFRYFPTKEALVLADGAQHLESLLEAFTARPAEEPVLVSLRAAILSLAAEYEQDRPQLLQRYRLVTETPTLLAHGLEQQANWEDALSSTITARIDASDDAGTRSRVLAAASMAVVRVAMRDWIDADGTGDMLQLVATALDLLIEELEPDIVPGR